MAAVNPVDPFVTTLEEGDPSDEGIESDGLEEVAFSAPGEPEGETTEPETDATTTEPEPPKEEPQGTQKASPVDEDVQAKLARLDQLERDHEISRIIKQREEAARQAEIDQAKAAAERKQVDDYFANRKNQLKQLFAANQLSPEQFIDSMDELAAARVEVSNRQMQAQVADYVQNAIEGRLGQISQGYRERTMFREYAPEYVQADPRVEDVIERWVMAGIPREEISILIEAGRSASKTTPSRRTDTQAAKEAARRAGAVEPPTRATRPSKQSEAEEDKEIRAWAKEMFS